MSFTLNEIRDMVHQNAVDHGFWDGERGDVDFLTHLERVHREVAEAGQLFDNFHSITDMWDVDGKPEGIPVELIDALIRILDILGHYGIDAEKVLLMKHAYNLTRPYKHGKRG